MYWPWISPLVVVSACAALFPSLASVPSWLLAIAFFGSLGTAIWPWLRMDAPYSYWIATCLVCVGLFALIVFAKILLGFR
jgi:hypothetical protein